MALKYHREKQKAYSWIINAFIKRMIWVNGL